MNIALIRTMDSQGRIVIPAEIRKKMWEWSCFYANALPT